MLCGGIDALFRKHGIPGHIRSHGAQFAFYFGYDDPQLDYTLSETVKLFRPDVYKQFVKECLSEKLYFYYGGDKPFPAPLWFYKCTYGYRYFHNIGENR